MGADSARLRLLLSRRSALAPLLLSGALLTRPPSPLCCSSRWRRLHLNGLDRQPGAPGSHLLTCEQRMSYRDPSRSAGVSVRRRWATVLTVLFALSLTGYMVSVFEDAEAIHGDFLRALKDSEPYRSSWEPQTFETQLASPTSSSVRWSSPCSHRGLDDFVLIGVDVAGLLKESGPAWGPLLLLTILLPPSLLQRLEGHSVVIKHAGSMMVHKSGLLWDGPVYSSDC